MRCCRLAKAERAEGEASQACRARSVPAARFVFLSTCSQLVHRAGVPVAASPQRLAKSGAVAITTGRARRPCAPPLGLHRAKFARARTLACTGAPAALRCSRCTSAGPAGARSCLAKVEVVVP